MGRQIDKNDPDEILLRQFHRVAGEFQRVTQMRGVFADINPKNPPDLTRKAAIVMLSEISDVLNTMTARREELRRQLTAMRCQLGAASAYARASALSGRTKRGGRN